MAQQGAHGAQGVQPKFRLEATQKLNNSDMFGLAVKKCPCNDFYALHIFEKAFFKFKHFQDLYPGKKVFFDPALQVPVSVQEWADLTVAPTLSKIGIRPCSAVDDMLCYKFYLCCSHPEPAVNAERTKWEEQGATPEATPPSRT